MVFFSINIEYMIIIVINTNTNTFIKQNLYHKAIVCIFFGNK